ncbi:MAG: DUF4214 domain-containing protein [Chelatococcus sp.]|uniref:glycerophosphodiester phosphodiesterase family protein n=1 Tax=Chelatococcus sp. TaxID=1953771 RepID=UPI0025BF16A6|nr:glycerophosphodiester phosphodiesterase family protein [Chelatococcus sp.]MBX3536974.1 DUF4214 domain-containing protein [Chelatococcus sp.]
MAETIAQDVKAPLVIGHRGASAYLPEHTIEAYKLAIEQGADVIEPDIVVTKDGHLIARHENLLNDTTDVRDHPEFAHLYTTKMVDGQTVSGWFAEDFTLAEIKTLYARERIPTIRPESAEHNDQYRIATLEEVIALVNQVEADTGKKIAIAPETKHPTYFSYTGQYVDGSFIHVDTSRMLVEKLVELGFTEGNRVYIQSFDVLNLIQLAKEIMPEAGVDYQIVQLLGGAADIYFHFNPEYKELGANPDLYKDFAFPLTAASALNGDLYTPQAVKAMAALYADFLAPSKDAIIRTATLMNPVDANGDGVAQVTRIVTGILDLAKVAHDAGLGVIPWTVRADEPFLALNPDGTVQRPVEEFVKLLDLGLDAIFTDFPDLGRMIVDQYVAGDGAIAATNSSGGNDILVRDPASLTAEKGTEGHDLALYGGDQAIVLASNIEDLRLSGSGDVEVTGNDLNNILLGNAGDNVFIESRGNDRIDGGAGQDMLVLSGGRGDYDIQIANGLVEIANTAQGSVMRVSNVETLRYADGEASLLTTGQSDLQGLYHAFFGREADAGGLDFWLAQGLAGQSVAAIAANFATSDEFRVRSEEVETSAFVEALYTKVLARAGDQGGRDFWVEQVNSQAISRAEVALSFARSDEAESKIALLTPPADIWPDLA